jgi:hypothetical protein
MTDNTRRPDRPRLPGGGGAEIAIASVWLFLYLAIVVVTFVDHPGAAIDVAAAAGR